MIRGSIRTRQRRITDILNQADEPFLVVSDATIDEYGSRDIASEAEYAQVNLGAVLFAVAGRGRSRRGRTSGRRRSRSMAMISIPPFRIIGRIHLLPERDLHEALGELTGNFIPVTEATYWSDTIGEARATAPDARVQPQPGAHPRAAHARSTRGTGSTGRRRPAARSRTSRRRPPRHRRRTRGATCPEQPDRTARRRLGLEPPLPP